MSEDRDENSGQFTASTDGLYGRDAELVEAGYKPMPDPEKEKDPEIENASEAADILNAIGVPEVPDQAIIYYDRETGEPLNIDPKAGPVEAITIERAARDLSAWDDAKAADASKSISKDFAAEIDRLRAAAVKDTPELAEHLGIEPPPKAEAEKPAKAELPDWQHPAEVADGELDPVLQEQIQKHPQVREWLATEASQTHQVREQYSTGLNNANAFAQAAFLESFPELSGLAPAQLEQGLAMLAQVDPPKFNTAMNMLGRVQSIQQAQQQDQQQRAYAAHQEFQTYGKSEDAKFRQMFGNDHNKIQEAATEVVSYLSEMGVGRDQLVNLLQTNPVIRSAEGQKILADAAKYRAMKNAIKPVATRTVPPVQKPGVARPATNAASAREQELTQTFNRTGSLKAAQELYALQSNRRAS